MLKDLYAPARYLSDSHQGRHRREQFGAALRCCALFREELFFTDRTMLHSDAVFAAWMSDPEARALICSELVQVGSTEAWPEEPRWPLQNPPPVAGQNPPGAGQDGLSVTRTGMP
jgi:hypothetical protein